MNAVIAAVGIMLILSLSRVHVVIALIIGALVGGLVFLIRHFGGYPDGVAFSVLLCNILVPLIDKYSQSRVYGH